MSKIEVNAIEPQCGTTLTLGASGDTVTLGSGASQSGFGRTGTVDWQTSIKTSGFTAENGKGYFCNTTGGAFTVTLPASPSAGDIVAVKDYANTFDTNNLTIGRNSSNIGGVATDATVSQEGIAVTLVYADATKGWLVTDSGLQSESPTELYVAATGGNSVSTCGDYKIHTFTAPGTFTVSCAGNAAGNNELEYIVVAGGGGTGAGGGGAGGFRYASPSLAPVTYPAKPLTAPAGLTAAAQAYPITVGAGGVARSPLGGCSGNPGSNSIFSTITSAGGGGGGKGGATGLNGGSGGGAGYDNNRACVSSGNTPPVSPPQGNNGGSAPSSCHQAAAGGGGALAVGANGTRNPSPGGGGGVGGNGGVGAGVPNAFGTSGQSSGGYYYFAGGGAGGSNLNVSCGSPAGRGSGGLGGGGQGGQTNGQVGCNATANTGGGGGGSEVDAPAGTNGGSGIVIIRYKFQ